MKSAKATQTDFYDPQNWVNGYSPVKVFKIPGSCVNPVRQYLDSTVRNGMVCYVSELTVFHHT